MKFILFDAPLREPGQFVGFAGNRIDRRSETRSDDCVDKALADPASRLVVVAGGRAFLKLAGEVFDPYFAIDQSGVLAPQLDEAVLLGWSAAGPVLAAVAGIDPAAPPPGIKAIDYRSVYAQGLLDEEAMGALAQAAALVAWHGNHRYCGRCGSPTLMRAGGYKRICANCSAEHFPRTDPVAIMLAVTRERCILGRSPHFPPGMYSALAGYIEPGETVENAVRREVHEESGIAVGRVVYFASQPWPFPYSLMIGCFGEAVSEDVRFDARELEDCRWFSRGEVRDILSGSGDVFLPPQASLAHHLIRSWAESY